VTAFVGGFGVSTFITSTLDTAVDIDVPIGPTTAPSTQEPTAETPPTSSPPSSPDEEAFELYWEVWDLLERNFYGELPSTEDATHGAIRGMLETFNDEYTVLVEADIAEIFAEDLTGEFQGIGAFVSMREDGKLEIVSVFSGQPAELSGLQSGDRVLAVDGESIIGFDLYEAISLIRGPAGTEVTLSIERPGDELETFEVTITRARIEIPLVNSEILENDIAYIQLTEFSSTATVLVEAALEEVLAEDPVGLILDLRSNPGGWLDQAVGVADLFLNEGVILTEREAGGTEQSFNSYDGDLAEDIPLVVLVNGGSASGSEIVAGAVQARDRGILIGEQTFGKGSVWRPYTLSDGSELRITTALWFLPDGAAIHQQGLEPDIIFTLGDEELEPDEDPQLDRAVEYILNGE
jgi:carboxyl-terminal processing protease